MVCSPRISLFHAVTLTFHVFLACKTCKTLSGIIRRFCYYYADSRSCMISNLFCSVDLIRISVSFSLAREEETLLFGYSFFYTPPLFLDSLCVFQG